MAITIEIGGVDKTDITKMDGFRLEWKLGAQSVGRMRLYDLSDGSYTPTLGQEFVVKDSGTPIWGGSIDDHEDTWQGGTVLFYDLTVVGYELLLGKRIVNAAAYGREFFSSNSISDILTILNPSQPLQNGYPVGVRSSGTLPAPLSASTKYYVVNRTSSTVQLSTTSGGAAVNLTDDGSGYHWIVWYTGAAFSNANLFYGSAEGLNLGLIRDGVAIEPGSPFEWSTVSEMNSRWASISGYVWFVDPDGKEINFVPTNEFTAPFSITAASTDVLFEGLTFRPTREGKSNRVHVRINEEAFGPTLVNFTGDGSNRIFRVATVIKTISSISVNAAVQETGIYGVDTGKPWYYTPGDRWIIQDSGETVLTGGDTLSVLYRAYGQDARTAEDTADQTSTAAVETGTSGIYESVRQIDSISSIDAGDAEAESILAASLTSPIEMSYQTRTAGLRPGQKQNVVIARFDINRDFLIQSVDATIDDDGKIRYSVKSISTGVLSDHLTLFRSFLGTGGTSSTGGAAIGGGGGTSSLGIYYAVTLTAATTEISRTVEVSGTQMILDITQDATGGREITWSTDFEDMLDVYVNVAPNARTTYNFFSTGTKWRGAIWMEKE